MPKLSELEKKIPPGSVVVGPDAFADTWDEKPKEEVCMGLRFLPDGELEDARIEAMKRAHNLYPNHTESEETTALWISSFQDSLVRWVIARGTCDPNDVSKPWYGWAAAPEDMVPLALTDNGCGAIYDAWERMRVASNIAVQPATDEDLKALPALLSRLPVLEQNSRQNALRLRRFLRFVLEELEQVEDPNPPATSS